MVPLVATALTAEEIRDVNTRYHDAAAAAYDSKWGIDFGEVGRDQVILKLTKALGRPPPRYARSLEIGAGTGYFTLNMMRAGLIERATCSDISPGMLATSISPSFAVRMRRVMARPRPVPPWPRLVVTSGSKMRPICSGEIPCPVAFWADARQGHGARPAERRTEVD